MRRGSNLRIAASSGSLSWVSCACKSFCSFGWLNSGLYRRSLPVSPLAERSVVIGVLQECYERELLKQLLPQHDGLDSLNSNFLHNGLGRPNPEHTYLSIAYDPSKCRWSVRHSTTMARAGSCI